MIKLRRIPKLTYKRASTATNPMVITEKNKVKPQWISVKTNNNHKAISILNFFERDISTVGGYIIIHYENCDQIPSICRLLVNADINIKEIYINRTNSVF